MIDQIWLIYDDDGNEVLDYKETKQFVIDYFEIMGSKEVFNGPVFNRVFEAMDEDGGKTIEKGEMLSFIKKLNEYLQG